MKNPGMHVTTSSDNVRKVALHCECGATTLFGKPTFGFR